MISCPLTFIVWRQAWVGQVLGQISSEPKALPRDRVCGSGFPTVFEHSIADKASALLREPQTNSAGESRTDTSG